MSLQVLRLDTLRLTKPDNELKLTVVPAVDIRIPHSISTLDNGALVGALTSGNLWVSRGVACHLEIRIFFNGKPLDPAERVNLLESLGYKLRDAQLWSHLSLSASLDPGPIGSSADSVPDLWINLNRDLDTQMQQARQRAWELDTFDIKPPDSFLCAEFERMQIQFDFLDIRKKPKRAKTVKSGSTELDIEAEILLDSVVQGDVGELAHTVDRMRGLPGLIEGFFVPELDLGGDPDLLRQVHVHASAQDQEPFKLVSIEDDGPGSAIGKSKGKKKSRHPKTVIDHLNTWLEAHPNKLYPSKDEKLELASQTNITIDQVHNWFRYQRRKHGKGTCTTEDELLRAQRGYDAPLRDVEDQENDDMLLYQAMKETPSLTSQSSATSSILSSHHRESFLKRSSPGGEVTLLDKSPACELGEAAIHILMSGQIGRGLRGISSIQVEKPSPSLLMANIAPSTFSPGFKESMAHNAQFLPAISHAISVSWPRNVQSPSLRKKLSRLASFPMASLTNKSRADSVKEGTTDQFSAVVQSRLWGMMHRKLYDPSDAAKIWRKCTLQDASGEDGESPDLLGTLKEEDVVKDGEVTDFANLGEDEFEEFEELLSRGDEDLLDYMEERERLSIERETDEMLFGGGRARSVTDEEDVVCHLCGVSFSIARIRTIHEPPSTAWRSSDWSASEGTFVMDKGLYRNGGRSEGACSKETGCCIALRTESDPNVRQFGGVRLKDEDVKGEFGEEYGEETDGKWEGESEDDETLEYVSDDDESSGVEMEDVAEEKAKEDTYCEDYLTLIRNLRDETDTPEPETFYPIEVDSDDSLETCLWGPEKANPRIDPSGQEIRVVGIEHIAGPSCRDERGYNGYAISAAEMKHSTTYQMLAYKPPSWKPEADDQEWEEDSECFLTGIGDRFPSRDMASPNVYPARHGWDEGEADTYSWNGGGSEKDTAMPFHPACFDIFTRLSKQRFGKIDIHGLISWRNISFGSPSKVPFSMDLNVQRASRTNWQHHSGSEYLAANPIYIPGLRSVLEAASKVGESFSLRNSAFESLPPRKSQERINTEDEDPFLRLSQELRELIVDYLSSSDIAALRLGSRAFHHLPIALWYKLLRREMPWLWEVHSSHVPSFWTALEVLDWKREAKEREKFYEDRTRRRNIIIDELPEALEAWEKDQPRFVGLDAKGMAEKEAQSMGWMLQREGTNWYELFKGVQKAALKGLRNRKRIWWDVEKVVQTIDRLREEGTIID